MINKKITKVLSCFSPEDYKQFKKFLQSEYHTSDSSTIPLFDFIQKNMDSENYTLPNVFEAVFPDEQYSQKKINNKCSDLSLLAEEFLAIKTLKSNNYFKEKLLSVAYEQRNRTDNAESRFKKIRKTLDATPKDEFYYLRKTALLLEYYFSPETKKFNFKKSELLYKELRASGNNLIYLLKISLGIEDIARSRFYDTTYADKLLPIILELTKHSSNQILHLYRLAYILVKNEELAVFKGFKTSFLNIAEDLSRDAKNTFSSILLNYSTRNVKTKLNRNEVLDLALLIIDKNLLAIDGFFPPSYFSNICIISTEVNKPDLTLKLLDFGKKHLDPTGKAPTLAKCWAYHHFAIGEYALAQKNLQKVPQTRINDRLQVSILEIRCLYEEHLKGEFTILDHKLEAYKKLFYRNKSLNPTIQTQNLNFLKITTKLFKKVTLDATTRASLLHEVEHSSNVIARDWLVEKIKNHA